MAIGIGEELRAARRQYGRSLADAAAETRVRETYLAALEEEEFASLGGSVYVKGFLRSYAKFLGLDPEPLLVAYRAEYERDEEIPSSASRPLAPMGPRERRGGPAVIVVAAGALLLVLAAIGLVVGGDDGGEEQTRERGPAPVEEDEDDPGTAASPPGTATPTPTPTELPQIDGIEVAVAVTGAISWMRVEVDGETIVEGEQQGGFSRTFTGEQVVEVRIGDASAVSLEANGADQGPLGAANEVVQVTCSAGEDECDVDVAA
ncbi:MAG: RodZ domain-containing protein [Egibacteraceae bacterium]